ncbi:surface antigen-domain-containing protein, partial [Catenaria anguillulae PL171]
MTFPHDPHIPSYDEQVKRASELLARNANQVYTIRSIQFQGVQSTRRSLLQSYIAPLLSSGPSPQSQTSASIDGPVDSTTPAAATQQPLGTAPLATLLLRLQSTAASLGALGIFDDDISIDIDSPPATSADGTSHNLLDVTLRVRERPRIRAETGTQMGNNEGNVHASLALRNLFGGAERVEGNVTFGTRTHSSFEALLALPKVDGVRGVTREWQVAAHQVHRSNQAVSSYDELARQLAFRLVTGGGSGLSGAHTVQAVLAWRQVMNVGPEASLSIRHEAGHALKAALQHAWIVRDSRDSGSLPTRGTYLRVDSEVAGGGHVGNVHHVKSEVEAQWNVPFGLSGWSLSNSLRLAALVPTHGDIPRISDRVFAGGPTSVRGFAHHGLGPKDGKDALGGTLSYSAGVSLFAPVFKDKDWLRAHVWANAGQVAMGPVGCTSWQAYRDGAEKVVRDMVAGPSVSVGVGLAIRHPIARVELNFGVPVVVRKGDEVKRGWGFGLGVNFL